MKRMLQTGLGQHALRRFMTAMLVVMMVCTAALPATSWAAENDQIRVTLFIETRGTVPVVTLSSSGGLMIGHRSGDVQTPWFRTSVGETAKISLEQFRVKVLSTTDAALAKETARKLSATTDQVDVRIQPLADGSTYEVYGGSFPQVSSALDAAKRWASYGAGGFVPVAVGPYSLEAGTFASLEEAQAEHRQWASRGINGHVVISESKSLQPVYGVWLGEAVDAQALEAWRQQYLAIDNTLAGLLPADLSRPYAKITAGTNFDAVSSALRLIYVKDQSTQLTVASASGPIKVAERYAREYRGQMEVTGYKGKLALINQLSMDEYLYSVVGAEMGEGWPAEALKAQAVAARSIAMASGVKYEIAHVSDTTFDQVYFGINSEGPGVTAAVDATRGEVLLDAKGKVVLPFFHSNAGGKTADGSEVWGNPVDYAKVITSPDDVAATGKKMWYKVVLKNGTTGYVRSDLTRDTQEVNAAGLPILQATEPNLNVRKTPYVDNANAITQLALGEELIKLGEEMESTAYRWVRGPYTAAELKGWIEGRAGVTISGDLRSLEVSKRGPSDRVLEMTANGQALKISGPDRFRTVFNSLPSTRYDVEQTGTLSIIGAGNQLHEVYNQHGGIGLLGYDQGEISTSTPQELIVLGADGQARTVSKSNQFVFTGYGYGHGLGMSQWGARGLTEYQQYNYQQILLHYFQNITIERVYE